MNEVKRNKKKEPNVIHCSKLGSSGSLFFSLLFVLRSMVLTIFSRQAVNYSSTSSLSSSTKLNSIEKKDKNTNLMRFFFLVSIPLPSVRPHSTPLRLIKSFAFVDRKSISSHFWLMVHFETGQSRPQTLANSPKADFFRNWNHMKCKLYDANRITLTICTSA